MPEVSARARLSAGALAGTRTGLTCYGRERIMVVNSGASGSGRHSCAGSYPQPLTVFASPGSRGSASTAERSVRFSSTTSYRVRSSRWNPACVIRSVICSRASPSVLHLKFDVYV